MSARRSWLRHTAATASVVALAACGGGGGSTISVDDDAVAAFARAVELEDGVVPLLIDVGVIGAPAAPVTVTRTPDPSLRDVTHLVARTTDPAIPLIGFTFRPDADTTAPVADSTLLDGTPVEVANPSPPNLATTTPSGGLVDVSAPKLALDEAVDVLARTRLGDDQIAALPDGWTVVGSVPWPTWLDGHSTTIELEENFVRSVFVTVERARGDRELLARFGPTEPADLDTGGWAYRYGAGAVPGYVFEYGDDLVVSVTGDLTDEQFRDAIASLREAEPGEVEIEEPAPWPPDSGTG